MICAVFYENPLVLSRGWDEGSVQSYLSQWMKGGVWPSPLKGQYTPPTVTAATSRPKPMCLLWPRLAGYLPSAPHTHLHLPCSGLACVHMAGALWPPASARFGQWRAPQERGGQEPVELGYLFFLPKGHQGLAHSTAKGHNGSQVALSQQFRPSKFHNCSLPSPVRPTHGDRAPLPLALESRMSPAHRR